MNKIITSEHALNAQTILWKTGRSSRVVGFGVPPVTPYYQNGWKLEIVEAESESTMPMEVRTRLDLLRKNGIHISHVLVAHELDHRKPPLLEVPVKAVVDAVVTVLPVLASILCAVVSILMAVASVLFHLFLFVFTLDPVVIVVLEDGTWLEVAKWYE